MDSYYKRRQRLLRYCRDHHKSPEEAVAELNIKPSQFRYWMRSKAFAYDAMKMTREVAQRRDLALMYAAAAAANRLHKAMADEKEISDGVRQACVDLIRMQREVERAGTKATKKTKVAAKVNASPGLSGEAVNKLVARLKATPDAPALISKKS